MKKHIGYLIKNVNDRIKSRADAEMKALGLTLAHSRVLAFLSHHGGMSTQKEIEVFLEIAHPTVVGILSRMERNGYITCTVDEKNKRNKLVAMTERAVEVRNEIVQKIAEDEKRMVSTLSEPEVESLTYMLEIIYKNLA